MANASRTVECNKKAKKLLGISNSERPSIGSMFCNVGLDWFQISDNIDVTFYLKKTEKFAVNIQNNCRYALRVSIVSNVWHVDHTNIINRASVEPDHVLSLSLSGRYEPYCPILIDHDDKINHVNRKQTYMIYIPHKIPSLQPHHYLTIYSSNIYNIESKQHEVHIMWNLWLKFKLYLNIIYLDIVLWTLIILTYFNVCISIVVSALMATLLGKYMKWTNHTNWENTIEQIATCLVLILCMMALICDNMVLDLTCDKLLSLTNLQLAIFNIVIVDYSIDFAIHSTLDIDTLCHHIFGWIGVVTLSSRNVAGGIITLLLLDCVTIFVGYFGINHKSLCYWILFILVRVIWYNWICYKGVGCIGDEYVYVKSAVVIWWCLANLIHIRTLYDCITNRFLNVFTWFI